MGKPKQPKATRLAAFEVIVSEYEAGLLRYAARLVNDYNVAQDVVQVSHRDDPKKLVRKGKDVEKRVLSQAIRAQLEHKILPFGNKTIVFE